jgi:ABC-type Mn2+/Zn2+ transport system permease subunit
MSLFALPFVKYALLATLMAGLSLSLLGAFVLTNRVSFAGLAVSQLAALGTVVGAFVGLHYGEFGMALLFVGLGMALLARLSKTSRAPQESWVAALYILGAGLAVLILSKAPHGETHTLSVFFGNVLSLGAQEAWEAAALLGTAALVLAVWFHRWLWISFDPVSVEISGLRTERWNAFFNALFAVAMIVAIHIFGVLLAFAFLLAPATIGLLLCRRIGTFWILIAVLSPAFTLAGFFLSFHFDFPTGPFIAALLACAALSARFLGTLSGR